MAAQYLLCCAGRQVSPLLEETSPATPPDPSPNARIVGTSVEGEGIFSCVACMRVYIMIVHKCR